MGPFNCIIIDDDEIDRLTVVSFAKKFPILNILGVFTDALEALPILEKEHVQVLFLDIDMPQINGIEFRKMAAKVPVCIFISAHPEHAAETFALDTLDFIVKPLKLDRFSQALTRIEDYMDLRRKAELFEATIGGDTIYIKEGHEQTKVKLHDILYLEALKDYTKIVTSHKRHCVLSSLGLLLKESHFNSFVRVHRSYAVQKQFIKRILTHEVLLHNDVTIPVGRSYKTNLNALL